MKEGKVSYFWYQNGKLRKSLISEKLTQTFLFEPSNRLPFMATKTESMQ